MAAMPRTLLLALLATVVASCAATPLPPTDPGRWDVSKTLVRVYAVDQSVAIEAGRRLAEAHGFTVVDREEQAGGRTLLQLYTAGGSEAYDAGDGQLLVFRTSSEGPGATKVELKIGPAFERNATIAMMDEYEALLPEGTLRKREQ